MSRGREKELSALLEKYVDAFEMSKRNSGHYCITVEKFGQKRKIFTGGTPSDRRALRNLESDVRKIVAEMKAASKA